MQRATNSLSFRLMRQSMPTTTGAVRAALFSSDADGARLPQEATWRGRGVRANHRGGRRGVSRHQQFPVEQIPGWIGTHGGWQSKWPLKEEKFKAGVMKADPAKVPGGLKMHPYVARHFGRLSSGQGRHPLTEEQWKIYAAAQEEQLREMRRSSDFAKDVAGVDPAQMKGWAKQHGAREAFRAAPPSPGEATSPFSGHEYLAHGRNRGGRRGRRERHHRA